MDSVRSVSLLVLLLALGWFGIGEARAGCSGYVCDTKPEAYALVRWTGSDFCPVYGYPQANESADYSESGDPNGAGSVLARYHCSGVGYVATASASWVKPCPNPTDTWDPATFTCKDGEEDERCLALNSEFAGMGPQPRTWTSKCLANGCMAVLDDPTTTTVAGFGTIHRGTIRISGACGPEPPDNTPPDPEGEDKDKQCTPAGDGKSVCIKSNGDHCYSASTGRLICWTPGQTGTKTDADVAQKRTPGTDPQTPPTPPENTTLTPNPPTTTTTTTPGGNTIVTTTINYTTNTGTNAGDGNDGENTNGEPDEEGTGVTGGQDCDTAPACLDNREAVGCAILLQVWKNRCGHGIDPNVLSPDDQAFVDENSDDPSKLGPGTEEGSSGDLSSYFSEGGNGTDMSGVDDSGWAARGTCPINVTVPLRFATYEVKNNQLCQVLDALAALVLLAGYVAAAFIIHGQYSAYMGGRGGL